MPPKKREKDSESAKNSKLDHLQADHVLFLQAFEKPTQIYRFLRTRNMLSPIFLNRTVSYMKRRMSRSNKSRIGFKVDSLLEKISLKKSTELQLNSLGGYMTLTFLGFYDKTLEDTRDYQVKVETLLLKICHKKRKESSSAIVEVSVGSCSVPLNPSTSEPPAMASAVSIASDTFSPSQGPSVKSYMLMLRVTVTKNGTVNGSADTSEITNGDTEEPVTKRLKTSTDLNSPEPNWSKLYGSELIVYDKHNRCLLTNGEYDLVLHDTTPGGRSATIARSPHKALMAQWETIPNEKNGDNSVKWITGNVCPSTTNKENNMNAEANPFDIFKVRPLLKLKLSWSQEPTTGLVNRPKLHQHDSKAKDKPRPPRNASSDSNKNGEKQKPDSDESKRQQIIYQFIYNNNSRQQTEACDDLHCPWCSLDCGSLYSLLKHLKLCHSRFNFTYFPIPGGARIDVSINELYDGSYTGSPHDLIASQGRRSGTGPRAGPTRRTELTHVLIWRPRCRRRAQRHSLAEFLETDDNEAVEAQRPYLTGHNRLYHHTITCLPVYPNELDIDSENETDPLWLQQKTMMMIDEFTDVNEGEKELMKMWNLHVMRHNYVGDCQIPLACQMFLELNGKELLEKNLYRNFILHMSSLHDFGLLSPVALYQTMQTLNQMLADNAEAKEKMRESLKAQRKHWNDVGKYQQPVVIEQKPQTAKLNVDASPSVRRKTSNLQNANRMGNNFKSIEKSAIKSIDKSLSAIKSVEKSAIKTIDKSITAIKSIDKPLSAIKSIDTPLSAIKSIDKPLSAIKSIDKPLSAIKSLDKSLTNPGPSNGESKRKMSSGSIQSRKRSSIPERKCSV